MECKKYPQRPEWYAGYCWLCETRRTDVAKLDANGCGCEAELVICRDCLSKAFSVASQGVIPKVRPDV